jgi:hypothetical protein
MCLLKIFQPLSGRKFSYKNFKFIKINSSKQCWADGIGNFLCGFFGGLGGDAMVLFININN